MLADGYEPKFDRDYAYGHQGELALDGLLDALARGELRAEVKRKSMRDTTFYVELEQNAYGRGVWTPSGLSTTDAEVWACEFDTTGVVLLVPTERLRRAVALGLGAAKECGGSNPTRGRLLQLGQIIATRCDG